MIQVRHATITDLPRMVEIARRSVTAAQWNQSHYEQTLSSNRLALVIVEANHVVGFIVGRDAAGEWEIENIAVTADARRRGLGSHLMGAFLYHVRSTGGVQVFLEVRESNSAARLLYEKWAFVEAGRRTGYYHDPPEDALILRFYFPQ